MTKRLTVEYDKWQKNLLKEIIDDFGRYRMIYEDENTIDCWIFDYEYFDKFVSKRRLEKV